MGRDTPGPIRITIPPFLLAGFVAVEARRSATMLPLRLFRQRLLTLSNGLS